MGEKRTRRKEEEYFDFTKKKNKRKRRRKSTTKKSTMEVCHAFHPKEETQMAGLRLKNKKRKEEIVLQKGSKYVFVFTQNKRPA
jgi:hypothetical protein